MRVERLEVTVRGFDPGTVRSALGMLPRALAAEMTGGEAADGTPRPEGGAGAEPLARALAARVAAEIRARRAGTTNGE
jgi:hypothetical protein